ncbi:farnesol dehydrogenase-like [Stomoxys calcitrans]|uniref:farnesol dehydrogenase-like n=1 Tax=Stomoxys calcitrans TaxID=35570 RepID=UPI0027E2D333|nr:farnesol dehydrogenase-like [Stomoxys calcitrans]
MERWQNKVAVITGASSGIGAAIAKEFVMAGLKVVGLARRTHLIEEMKNSLPLDKRSQLIAIYCDLSKPESIDKAFDAIISQCGGIDVLVNNAICFKVSLAVNMPCNDLQELVQTNFMAIVHCTQKAFKSMKERNFNGHVIMINSIGGYAVLDRALFQMPCSNIYSPCKFALRALTELYRQEFHGLGTKIKISSISPGCVNTESLNEDYRQALEHCMLQPHDVSKAVLFMLSTPPHLQIHDMIIKPLGEKV